MKLLLARLGGVVGVTLIAAVLTHSLGVDSGWPVVMALQGGFFFFIGPAYLTGAGFFVRGGHHVDSETPGCVWRFGGVMLWIIGAVILMKSM